jgi:hypothetical protein
MMGLNELRAFALAMFVFFSLPLTEAQGVNKYYSSPGNALGVCAISSCSFASCLANQYLANCNFNNSGTCVPCNPSTPPAGRFFSATGQFSPTCVSSPCVTCATGQVTANCGVPNTHQGTCTECSTPPNGFYYGANTGPLQTCAQAQIQCPAPAVGFYYSTFGTTPTCVNALTALPNCAGGFYRLGNTATAVGSCAACTNLAPTAGFFWDPAQQYTPSCSILQCSAPTQFTYFTTPGSCDTAAMTVCPAGRTNTGSSLTSAGSCVNCTFSLSVYYTANDNAGSNCPSLPCLSDCGIGRYRLGCGGHTPAAPGSCVDCTQANASQKYTTTGGLTDSCIVVGCARTCLIGQYITGCGGPITGLSCAWCTNSVPNVDYYIGQGTYLPTSCPTAPCPVFENGFYTLGCFNTSQGQRVACTNS